MLRTMSFIKVNLVLKTDRPTDIRYRSELPLLKKYLCKKLFMDGVSKTIFNVSKDMNQDTVSYYMTECQMNDRMPKLGITNMN